MGGRFRRILYSRRLGYLLKKIRRGFVKCEAVYFFARKVHTIKKGTNKKKETRRLKNDTIVFLRKPERRVWKTR